MDENNQNPMEPMQPMEPMNAEQPAQDNTQGQYQQYQVPQPEYQQPQYQAQPQYQQTQPTAGTPGNGLCVAALVLGIISIFTCWIPYVGITIALLALIFSIIGLVKKHGDGKAVAGLVLAILTGIPAMVVILLINTIFGALGWFGATLNNATNGIFNTRSNTSSVWNELGTLWNSVGNELGAAGNELGNLGNRIGNELNTVSNALSNVTSNSTGTTTTTTSNVDSKKTTVSSPAKFGEWATAAAYSSGDYIDTPVRVNKVYRGEEAEQAIKASGRTVSTKLTDGCEWCVIDYSVDMTGIKEVGTSRSLSGLYFYLRGNDGKTLKYDGKSWILTGSNLLSTTSIKTDVYNGQYLYQIPKGCTDYLIEAKSSRDSASVAYFKGE